MSVNSEMTALADAIREKSGRTEKMGIAAMKEAVKGISAGIDTSDATATATDIASGKTAYVDGQKITGNVVTLESGQTGYLDEGVTGFGFSATNNQFSAMIPMGYNVLLRNGSYINAPVSTILFGDATASDVAKGKTFTSASGLKLTGTFAGGGLPGGITEMNTGSFTMSSDAKSGKSIISHGLSRRPNIYVVYATGASSADMIGNNYILCEFGFCMPVYENDIQSVTALYNSNFDIVSFNYGNLSTADASKITIDLKSDAGLKAGITYHWIAAVVEGLQ